MNVRNENETEYTQVLSEDEESSDTSMSIKLVSVDCLICSKSVDLDPVTQHLANSGKTILHICAECKSAVLYAKELLALSVTPQTIEDFKGGLEHRDGDMTEDGGEENNGD